MKREKWREKKVVVSKSSRKVFFEKLCGCICHNHTKNMPVPQKIFRGRPIISVGQPKYNLTWTYDKSWPKISLGWPFSFCEPGYNISIG